MKIELRKDNVVKVVDSEDKAKVLEAKGFLRTDGKTSELDGTDGRDSFQNELEEAKAQMAVMAKENEVYKNELSSTKALLQKSEKKCQALEAELAGVNEQLEAALKKNKSADKK